MVGMPGSVEDSQIRRSFHKDSYHLAAADEGQRNICDNEHGRLAFVICKNFELFYWRLGGLRSRVPRVGWPSCLGACGYPRQ